MPIFAPDVLTPLWVSLRVVGGALCLLGLPGLWLGWVLATRRVRLRWVWEVLLTIPLVLPPTVLGYGLLYLGGRQTGVGRVLQDSFHIGLVFTLLGAAVASALVALPLWVRGAQAAFASVDVELVEMARVSGASEAHILRHVFIPLAYRGLLAALLLSVARALGEFGATFVIAGSIPGQTETLPLALYAAVQDNRDRTAAMLAAVLTGIGVVSALCLRGLEGRIGRGRGESVR